MKPLRKAHSTSLSCSCTSCANNSGSDRTSLQRFVLNGSKIDRLYYGKYIPLREKKLLDKLVRTRAVYDDIRAQLVSDSTSSLQKNAKFSPVNEDNDKSGAILEIVNLVDKGAALDSVKLSDCCSCCSCSSNLQHEQTHTHKHHKKGHFKGGHYQQEFRHEVKRRKGVKFSPKHIKSDPCTCTFPFLGLGGKRKKIKAEHKVDSVVSVDEEIKPRRHRVKRIAKKSLQNIADSKTKIQANISKGVKKLKDSKTKLQDNLASHVRESLEKIRKIDQFKPEPVYDEFVLEEENRKVRILKNAGRASFEKIRESQLQFKNRMLEGGEIMEAQVKRSIEKVKRTKNKIKANVKRSLEKLEEKRREQMRKAKVKAPPITPTSEETDIAIKVKKDSLVKFKENMAKKKVENDWICHKECEKGTCIPEECFERLKRKKARLNKLRGRRHMASMSEMRKRGKVVGTSSKNSSFKIQAKGSQAKLGGKTKTIAQADVQKDMKLTPTVSIKRLKQKTKGQKTSKPSRADVITKTNFKRTKRLKSLSDQRSSSRQAVRIGSSFSFNIEFYKNRPIPNVPKKALKQKNDFNQSSGISISRTRKVKARRVKVGNSGSQVIIQRSKNVITQKGHALKRCFCTLKLKKKRRKPAQTQRSVSTMSSIRMKDEKYRHKLLPYECEPGICVPGKCNPYECLKLQNRRQTHSKQSYTSSRKTKSTSSVTPKVRSSKAKQVQSAIMPRRKQVADREKLKLRPRKVINKADRSGNAVRIGSAFSFNIEFYKNTGSTNQLGYENRADINSFSIRPRVNYTQEQPHKRNVKLREKQKKRKISTTGTETVDYSDYIKVRDTSTKTENRIMSLLPYECEPFTCIPGECNPYMCLERIKRRNKNTREVSLGTISPENKSTSSYTQSRSKAAFVQYKPSTQERKILVKSKPVKKARQTQKSNVILGNTSKQAVNIGSSFSFNIEFSKNISKQAIEQDLKSSVQPINISTRHRVKQKGILIEKRKVGNADTQIRKVKQSDKSSIVGPMLKRCFCTLNLYKKQKRDYGKKKKIIPPSTYTVNTALIPNVLPRDNKPMDLEKNEEFLESLNINRSALRLIPTYSKLSTKQSLAINSDLSFDVKLVRKSFKMKQCISKESSHKSITFNNSFLKEEKGTLTGISQYIKRCFCAMNVQYETRKLKPYECEPGICIPGQCNPYECQKLIMKRLQKGYSKLSGTDSISRSISSSQTRIRRANESHMAVMSSSRPSYNRKQAHYRTVDGQKTKSKVGHKQAVRVGSTFSFDVEFYKNRPCLETKQPVYYSPSEAKLQKIKPRPRKMRGKNIYTRHPTSDSESQYFGRQMKHRGSQGLHNLNRCFCTLKLHKKGRFHGVGQAQTDLPKKLNGVRTVEKGQNTKALRMLPNLLPYECEPGICVPGECNPYECLARINKRNLKEMGTGTIRTSASASSNTIGPYRKYKSRGVRVKQRDRPIRHADKVKVVKTSHSNKRQAVRIGSTFSFNIDFYKDKTQSGKAKYKKQEKVEKVIIKPERVKVPRQKRAITTTTPRSSQMRMIQTSRLPHKNIGTTVKPFLQRCFCTLQLRNQRKIKEKHQLNKIKYKSAMTMTEGGEYKRRLDPNECEPGICVPYNCDPYECETWIQKRLRREKAHKRRFDTDSLKRNMDATKSAASAVSTFLKKCICTLKLNTKRLQNSPHLKFEVKPQRRNKNQFAKLEPYECEPNTCIPGECDPYECEKRIRKRLLRENATTTTQAKTTSQSTFTRNLRAHKGDYVNKQTYERPSRVMVQKLDKPKHVYQPKVPSHYEGQKQSVRIGSTFSFDVEFFKDRTFGDPAYRKRKNDVHRVRQYDTESNMTRRAKYRTKGQQFRDGFGRYDASQFAGIPTQSTSTITDPQLKRCFCTLQLHKSAASVNEMKRQPLQTQNKMTHTKNTLSYNVTSPYECPPFMCVPNECDPYECERKLRKLNIRSQAIGTEGGRRKRNRYIDAASVTTRTQNVQSNFVQKPKHYKEGNVVEVPRFTNYLKKENWQGVKVGSNVSFNIEFYKEFSPPGQKRKPKKIKEVVYDEPHLVTGDRGKYATKYVSPPHFRNLRNTESQVEARGMENKSSNTINRLKRCFCTLKLQKNRSALPVPYPQSFEVRRAEVQNKMFPKVPFPQAFDVFLTKTQKSQIKPKEQNTVEEKAVVTKITRSKVKKTKFKNDNEMQTILSYKPKKFDKKASKTILMENKINKKENKKKHRGKFSKKNRLTRKQSKLAMNTDKSCYCEKFVGPLKNTTTVSKPTKGNAEYSNGTNREKQIFSDLRTSHSDRRAKGTKRISKIRTSKSLMLEKNEVKGKPNIGDLDMLRGNKFEAGDSKEKPAKVGCSCMPMRNKTFEQKGDYKIENKGGPMVIKDNIKEGIKAYSKPTEISKDGKCPYCKVCLKGGIGFSLFTKFNACVNKIKGWPTKFFKVKKPLLPIIPKAPKLKPLFNVYLEADSLNIINKEEVTEKVTQLHTRRGKGATKTGDMRKKHGKDCQCCYCLKGKKDAAAAKKAKEKADKVKEKEKNKKEKKKQTCVCGSVACARHVQFLKRYKPPEKKVIQPCSCGSPICDEEIAIMNAIAENPGGIMCLCQEEMKRRKKILEKKQKKEYEKRRKKISKQHSKADKIRRKKRLESAKVMEKSIKGDKNDVMLVAESVVDVAKLGITGITDVLRIMYRCAKDPKHSWRTVKSMAKDPSLIGKTLKETYNDSGVAATGRRVGMRLSAMGSVKETKNLLEQHPITNYILHIADKDPKKRLRKARKVKRKERIDFGCNLYMSSLRKRPFMFIFDRCPSFYPHCLSIVNVWKQFAEVVTFLLAVVVWSPCIFCMEICRAVMCCTLCTG